MKVAAKKRKNLQVEENEGEKRIYEFLEYLPKSFDETCIFQSNSRTFQAALKSFLDENLDIFDDRELLDHLFEEIPVVMKILASIRAHEGGTFLPEAIKNLLEATLQCFQNKRAGK